MQLDERLNAWFASFGALLAGACALLLHLVVLRVPMPSGSRRGWSLLAVALLAGAVYAMRDRIKEISRAWLTGKVYRFYAQRIVRCRTVGRSRDIVVQAREWCNETTSSRPDLVNPESETSLPVTLVNHVHRGTLISQPLLVEAGVKRVRQVFRDDLSPPVPRLQDPIKRVPALDPYTARPQLIPAPPR